MQVLLHEMALEHRTAPQLLEDIQLLQQQVDSCSQSLRSLAHSVRDEQDSARLLGVDSLLNEVLQQWQLMRPQVTYSLQSDAGLAPVLLCSVSLRQALLNLLNNAADACPDNIAITLGWDSSNCWLRIRDHGPGLPLEHSEDLGKPFVTTKGRGLGIGLFLTTSTLASIDGEVRLYNHPQGGTLTEVRLPRKPIDRQPDEHA
jgi:two-component system sensor histidine kinase RegB